MVVEMELDKILEIQNAVSSIVTIVAVLLDALFSSRLWIGFVTPEDKSKQTEAKIEKIAKGWHKR
jgi:hypothetical protein